MMKARKHLKELIGAFAVASAVFAFSAATTVAQNDAKAPAYVGSEACLGCHEDLGTELAKTKHGLLFKDVKATGAKKGCEACHGAAEKHLDDSSQGVVRFGQVKASEASAVCLKCHSAGDRKDWRMTEHAGGDVSCVSCHSPHGKTIKTYKGKKEPAKLLKGGSVDLCLSCHSEKTGQISLPSHHPVKEGKVVCSDCHTPHGNTVSAGADAGSACIKCHTEKAGPFVNEHSPVADSCLNCHTPHGSVNQNLLKVKQPTLCLQCHLNTASDPVFGKHDTKLTKIKTCTNCHSAIHGSNGGTKFCKDNDAACWMK